VIPTEWNGEQYRLHMLLPVIAAKVKPVEAMQHVQMHSKRHTWTHPLLMNIEP
jgi:hypothetical protein